MGMAGWGAGLFALELTLLVRPQGQRQAGGAFSRAFNTVPFSLSTTLPFPPPGARWPPRTSPWSPGARRRRAGRPARLVAAAPLRWTTRWRGDHLPNQRDGMQVDRTGFLTVSLVPLARPATELVAPLRASMFDAAARPLPGEEAHAETLPVRLQRKAGFLDLNNRACPTLTRARHARLSGGPVPATDCALLQRPATGDCSASPLLPAGSSSMFSIYLHQSTVLGPGGVTICNSIAPAPPGTPTRCLAGLPLCVSGAGRRRRRAGALRRGEGLGLPLRSEDEARVRLLRLARAGDVRPQRKAGILAL